MTKQTLRTANLLGAAVLGLHDELRAAVESSSGHSGETPAAIVAIGHQPGLSNDRLSQLLGLTHTGTVRLIDRLAADGLVDRRRAAHDGRGVALYLTADGAAQRGEILSARATAMMRVLARLGGHEQKTLAALLGKLLQTVSRDDTHKLRICRLCDGPACGECPIRVAL
ncbi:MAG: MarR family winged helix-turn-helix transcriptional regulator [Alphaproteobacteria bacterium]|nr:MarR family winged helix-turn-helix transcriptional regulator [Alphaproteobacteria bacterium]